MPARNSEIRSYLLRYAAKKGILVREHVSEWGEGPTAWFCHLQSAQEPPRTATAVSYEGHDNALVMAFLTLGCPEITFLPD